MSEPKRGNSRQARMDANQLERLFDLLPNDAYDVVAKLPYASRVQIERWYAREADRLEPAMGKVVAGVQHRTPAVTELLEILAAETLDLQQAGTWLGAHRDDITPQLLAELVSAAMGRGVMDLMSERAGKRQGANREKKAEAVRLWHEEFQHKPGMSKANAAGRIAKLVGLAASTVRGYLQGL